jgi:6-pyruvoyl tetrahydropterin synthase/QueD family protein
MPEQLVRVTKRFNFEAAHALEGYDGACRNIHGHSYKLWVTIKGPVLPEPGNPKDGMVLDFKILKTIVEKHILETFDHGLILNINTPLKIYLGDSIKSILLPFRPTSENLICHFAEILQENIPKPLSLYSLKLAETESSFVEWFEVDRV